MRIGSPVFAAALRDDGGGQGIPKAQRLSQDDDVFERSRVERLDQPIGDADPRIGPEQRFAREVLQLQDDLPIREALAEDGGEGGEVVDHDIGVAGEFPHAPSRRQRVRCGTQLRRAADEAHAQVRLRRQILAAGEPSRDPVDLMAPGGQITGEILHPQRTAAAHGGIGWVIVEEEEDAHGLGSLKNQIRPYGSHFAGEGNKNLSLPRRLVQERISSTDR